MLYEVITGTLNGGVAMVVVSLTAGTVAGIFYATEWKVGPGNVSYNFV